MPDQLPTDPSSDQNDIGSRLQAIQQRASQADPVLVKKSIRQPAVELSSWSAPGRLYDPKSPQWYLGLFAIGLISVIAFAILREVTLILVVAAVIFVYYALARVKPTMVEHVIYSDGLESGGRKYLWEELRSYWIYQDKGQEILRIDTKKHFPHTLELLISDISPSYLDDLLDKYLVRREVPASEAGAMADNALISVANKIPYRDKLLKWVENSTGTKLD